uniref:Uncharacterized protein n=1 Tax=Myotis myotis TaxID=51298 RepID=A0A7J7UPP4_MYOMY|nr:hypothetical protein mMyoMyo1_008632 [Myotis myotis]
MFIAALSTTAKTRKQPKCPSMDECVKKVWLICTMGYYSVIKKKEILPIATTSMDLEVIILSEIRPTEKDRYYMISVIHVEPRKEKKKKYKERNKEIHRKGDQICVRVGGGRMGCRYKIPVIRQTRSKEVTYRVMTIIRTAVWYI